MYLHPEIDILEYGILKDIPIFVMIIGNIPYSIYSRMIKDLYLRTHDTHMTTHKSRTHI